MPNASLWATTTSSPASRPTHYFHVPDEPDYPVVPTFDDWRFPNSLPSAWLSVSTDDDNNAAQATTQSNFSAGVKMRDRTCRLSNHSSATETAHLCPEKEEAWYLRNDMQVWNLNQIPNHINMTRDIANCLLLCSNLHKTFDDRIWVFFPKGSNTLVAHFLQAAPDQAALYHNVAARPVQCEPHFIYARFAWAIISLLRAYLSKSTPRRVKVWVASENEWQERIMDGQQLRRYVRPSRSTSPTKRSRGLEDTDVEPEDLRTTKRHKYSRSVATESESTAQSTVTGPSLAGDADDCSGCIHVHESADSADEQGELEEDLVLMRRRFPQLEGMPESQKPMSWYPGWRRVERLKQTCIAADRRRSVPSPDAQQVVASNQYAVTGCESVAFAPITGEDSGDDNCSYMQGD
jgi:hypothetical protein